MNTLTPAKIEELAYNAGMSLAVNKHGNWQFCGHITEMERFVNMVQVKTRNEGYITGSTSGCNRSHPHENMSVECALKAEIAWLRSQLEVNRTELSSYVRVGMLLPCKEGAFVDVDKPVSLVESTSLFIKVNV